MKFMLWLLFLLMALFFPQAAMAEGEFKTTYSVEYQVKTNGLTQVKMHVELVNKLSNIYASEFTLSIGSTNLSDVRLSNGSGLIEPKIVTGNKTTNVTVVFPEKVLGKDNSQQFTLEFLTSDFARQLGNVWEITIPRLAKSESLDSYRLTLSVPESLGQAATITPAPISQKSSGGTVIFQFDQQSLFNQGISATFGEQQWYDFDLTYNLNNPHFYPVVTEIALPPDTAWQQLLYQTLEPEPESIQLDGDGNWLASYKLGPAANLKVTATGSATLFLKPRPDYPWGINPQIDYLKPLPYWEADQPRIKSLAETLITPRKIYDYLVDNLIYDYGRLSSGATRLGAANTLDSLDSALCQEFTDLFIALSRAAGIQARAVNGYAYTDNSNLRPLSLEQDILHAWPEYYDNQRELWRPVDPTWGNTTGGVDFFEKNDLNHFAFVILGNDSSYPIPAGAYRINSQPEKNVQVVFGRSVLPDSKVNLDINLPDKILSGVSLTGKILVKNLGNVALYQVPVNLSSDRRELETNHWQIEFLPPKSKAEINFSLPPSAWNSQSTETLTAVTDLDQSSRRVELTPIYLFVLNHRYFHLGLLTFAGLAMIKLIYARLVKTKPLN